MKKIVLYLFVFVLFTSVVSAACDYLSLEGCDEKDQLTIKLFVMNQYQEGGYNEFIYQAEELGFDIRPLLDRGLPIKETGEALPGYLTQRYGRLAYNNVRDAAFTEMYVKGLNRNRVPDEYLEKQYGSLSTAAMVLGVDVEALTPDEETRRLLDEVSGTNSAERAALKVAVSSAQSAQRLSPSRIDGEEYKEAMRIIQENDLGSKIPHDLRRVDSETRETLITILETTDAKTTMQGSITSDLAIRQSYPRAREEYENQVIRLASRLDSERERLLAEKTILETERDIAQFRLDETVFFDGAEKEALAEAEARLASVEGAIAELELQQVPVGGIVAGIPEVIAVDPITGEPILTSAGGEASINEDRQFNLQENSDFELSEQAKFADVAAREFGVGEVDRMRLVEGIRNGDPNAIKAYQSLIGAEVTGRLDAETRELGLLYQSITPPLLASCADK